MSQSRANSELEYRSVIIFPNLWCVCVFGVPGGGGGGGGERGVGGCLVRKAIRDCRRDQQITPFCAHSSF